MRLNYKASNIAKAEAETGKKFFDIFTSMGSGMPSVNDLLFLFSAGGGSEDEFDELFAKGVDQLMLVIMQGVSDAGFLGTKVDLNAIKKSMEKAKSEAATSQTSGETAKA